MSMRYRLFPLALLLLAGSAWCFVASPVQAQSPRADQQTSDRARLLRTLDLVGRMAGAEAAAPVASSRTVSADGVITGVVHGLDADAFASASVVAWTPDSIDGRLPVNPAVLAPDGTYRIDGLAAGDYYVMALADGYHPTYHPGVTDFAEAVRVPVPEAGLVEGVDFKLARIVRGTGSIAGTVRTDVDGHPVGGAVVYAFSSDNPFSYARVATGGDGTYVLEGLTSGRYHVEVWADGYLSEFYDDAPSVESAAVVEVVEPGRTANVDFGLSAGASLSGYVLNEAGQPIAGAYVQASSPLRGDTTGVGPDGTVSGGRVVRDGWAFTDESGFYRISGLVEGTYHVYAQAATRWFFAGEWYDGASSFEAATPVVVATGAEVGGIDFTLDLPAAWGAIAGRVVDEAGQPIVNAFITVHNVVDPAGEMNVLPYLWAYATTDAEGYYVVDGLPAASYLVSAAVQSGWRYVQRWYDGAETPDGATPVVVAGNVRLRSIDFVLPVAAGSAGLSGTVRDTGGTPLPGAFVEVTPAEVGAPGPGERSQLWAYAQADSSGVYRVGGLPAGTYVVRASYGDGDRYGHGWYDGADSPEAATPIVLVDREARSGVDFALAVRPLYGTVAGTVTDAATGAPLARAYVELSPVARDYVRDAPFRFFSMHAITDAAGRFEMTYIPEGTYVLTVYADGGFGRYVDPNTDPLETPFAVVGGEVAAVDVALALRDDGTGVIAGTVSVDLGQEEPGWVDGGPRGSLHRVTDGAGADTTGLGGAVVVAYPVASAGAGEPYSAVTAPDGTYTLRGLAPGDYVVMSFAPGYVGTYYDGAYGPDTATPVHVDGQQPAAGVDFALSPVYYFWVAEDGEVRGGGTSAVAVYGRVTDAGGAPVAVATVYLLDEAEQPVASVQTSADGSFELSGVVPGSYRVYAGKLGFRGSYNGNARGFAQAEALALSGGRTEVNLVLTPGSATHSDGEPDVPHALALARNYPNPFNPATRIAFTVPQAGPAALRVYNVLGQEVAVLFDGRAEAGRRYEVDFHAAGLSTGVYLYTLDFGGQRLTHTMLLVK